MTSSKARRKGALDDRELSASNNPASQLAGSLNGSLERRFEPDSASLVAGASRYREDWADGFRGLIGQTVTQPDFSWSSITGTERFVARSSQTIWGQAAGRQEKSDYSPGGYSALPDAA